MRSFRGVVRPALVVLFVTAMLLLTVRAINVELPDEFVQCEPAQINLSQSRGNVTIVIRRAGVRKPISNVSLPLNASSWIWPSVNFPANANFTILVTDRSPHKKTRLSQSLFRSSVDPSPSNNDTCLPSKDGKGREDGDDRGGRAGRNDEGDIEDGGADGPGPHHKTSTTEVAVIAGVLGGLMFVLLSLTLVMCLRRRAEVRTGPADGLDDPYRGPVMAQRLRDSTDGPYQRHQVVTLFGHDGQPEGQAVLGRQGDAGWTYMSRMVPELESSVGQVQPLNRLSAVSQGRRGAGRRRFQTNRHDGEHNDSELPSYGMSEYERKHLPKYDEGMRTQFDAHNGHPILTTRRDSRGSRLTFSSPSDLGATRASYAASQIAPTPRGSFATTINAAQASAAVRASDCQEASTEDMIVFGQPYGGDDDCNDNHLDHNRNDSYHNRGNDNDSQLPYAQHDRRSSGSMETSRQGLTSRPSATEQVLCDHAGRVVLLASGVQPSTTAEQVGHRRSRSEVSLRRGPFG